MVEGRPFQNDTTEEIEQISSHTNESPWLNELRDNFPTGSLSGLEDQKNKLMDSDLPQLTFNRDDNYFQDRDRYSDYDRRRELARMMGHNFGFEPANYTRKDQSASSDESTRVENPLSATQPLAEIAARAKLDPAVVEKAREELVTHGVTPESLLPDLMKHNRVLALGEGHSHDEPQEKLLTSVMKELKEAGATHLAVENIDDQQAALDEFMRTGEFPDTLPRITLVNQVYLNTLTAAREAGLKIVAVDMPRELKPGELRPERDPYMAHKIDQILSESPEHKVVFLAGERHIDDFTPKDAPPKQPHTAVEYLRLKYDVASVGYQITNSYMPGLESAFSDLTTPTAVSSSRAETIANHKQNNFSYPNSFYDYKIFYPHNRH